MKSKAKDDVGEAEQERRRDEALRRALAMPPKHHRKHAALRLSADASGLLAFTQALDRALELVDRGVSLPEFPKELIAVQMDVLPAPGTREIRVRLDPSEGLRSFATAVGARNLDLGAIKNSLRHSR
jgi:hypothetical protein